MTANSKIFQFFALTRFIVLYNMILLLETIVSRIDFPSWINPCPTISMTLSKILILIPAFPFGGEPTPVSTLILWKFFVFLSHGKHLISCIF